MAATPEKKKNDWLESWHVAPANTQSYDFLDGIRGIAILLVLACHLLYVNPTASNPVLFVFGIFGAGTFGVTIFFALSGFLISLPFWKKKIQNSLPNLSRYAQRRFWKIAPPLILSVLVLTPLYIYFYGNKDVYLKAAIEWLTGKALVFPVSGRLNPVMWSLIVETHFYILLPLLFLLLKRLGYKSCLFILPLGFFIIPTLARYIYLAYGVEFSLHPVIRVNFPSKLDAFSVGILVAGLHVRNAIPASVARFAPLGFLGIALALVWTSWNALHPLHPKWSLEINNLIILVSSGLLLSFIRNPVAAGKWFLANPMLRWFGLLSYEWYLFHQPLFYWTRSIVGEADGNPALYAVRVLVPLLLSLAIAALVYRFFSLPILRATRGAKADS
ncbi:MAG: acyltransferase [Armatimonadetes bacterium]|nr:acyltransferase [Akkermansiaceae bacterium]